MLSKKNKKSIAISIAVSAAFVFFYIRSSAASYRSAVTKVKNDLALAELRQESWQLESKLPSVSKPFPPRQDASRLIDKIQDMARQSRMELSYIEPQPPVRQPLYERISFKLTSVCSYNALGNFISRLEGSKEFMRLDKLKLEPVAGQASADKESEAKAELVVTIIYLN